MTYSTRRVSRLVGTVFTPIILAVMFSGCVKVGPNYVQPETSVPSEWHNTEESEFLGTTDPDRLAEWWAAFDDGVLSALVEQAIEGNLDLRQAEARVREARARRGGAKADYFPKIDASGSASTRHIDKDDGSDVSSDNYSAGFDASWELDLFGGTRRSVEASTADQQATEEKIRDVLVSLIAELALDYTDVRVYQSRLKAAETNLRLQTETYQLISWRNQAGLSDSLAVEQARYNLESTKCLIPSLQAGLGQTMNHIAVLLGRNPGSVHALLEPPADVPVAEEEIAVGVPADVIRRRPDIRVAERQLAAQTARVGLATAELYPKFNLSGSIGIDALSLGGLFSSGDKTTSGGALISLPIFRGGSIRKNIEVQSAIQEQYFVAYESAVLGALEDVENALVAYAKEQERQEALANAARASRSAAQLAKQKYEAGLVDFSAVLDAQRSLVSFEDQLAESEGTLTANLIRLYKALGGGWHSLTVDERGTPHNTENNNEYTD